MDMPEMHLERRPANRLQAPDTAMAVGPTVAAKTRWCYRCCDVRRPVLRNCALLIDGRLEEAQDEPEALGQETIIENMSKDEAARLRGLVPTPTIEQSTWLPC